MATYFGSATDGSGVRQDNGGSNDSGDSGYAFWQQGGLDAFRYQCPGSGDQIPVEISAPLSATSAGGYVRLAIYTADGLTLMAYGTTKEAVVNSTDVTFQGHMNSGEITVVSNLTGESDYLIVLNISGNQVRPRFSVMANSFYYSTSKTYYDDGFPASLPAGTGINADYQVCCGVEAAAAADLNIWASECVGAGAKFG